MGGWGVGGLGGLQQIEPLSWRAKSAELTHSSSLPPKLEAAGRVKILNPKPFLLADPKTFFEARGLTKTLGTRLKVSERVS